MKLTTLRGLVGAFLPGSLVALYRRDRGRRARLRLQEYNRSQVFAHPEGVHFEIDAPHVGLFAHLTWVVGFLHWGEVVSRRVSVSCVSRNYGNGTAGFDWLSEILERRFPCVEAVSGKTCRIFLQEASEFPTWLDNAPRLTLEKARELFFQHFRIRGDLEEKAAGLVPVSPGVVYLGVHYRGTDKHTEARPVPHADVLEAMRRLKEAIESSAGGRICRMFLATDDAVFFDAVAKRFGGSVVAQPSVARSSDGKPLHRLESQAWAGLMVREAMVDALALARCPVILRTASFLSGWATLLSGESLMFMLNAPYEKARWFPDSLLAERAASLEEAERLVSEHLSKRGL